MGFVTKAISPKAETVPEPKQEPPLVTETDSSHAQQATQQLNSRRKGLLSTILTRKADSASPQLPSTLG